MNFSKPRARFLNLCVTALTALTLVFTASAASGAGPYKTYIAGALSNGPIKETTGPVVNVPYFNTTTDIYELRRGEMSIFWFGQLSSVKTYSMVRHAYNPTTLFVSLQTIDRFLWYNDINPAPSNLLQWDAVSLYLQVPQASGPPRLLRFDGQFNQWQERAEWQAVFERKPGGWQIANLAFNTKSGWRSDSGLNDDQEDKGWSVTFKIPFASLGTVAPASGELWRMAMAVYDRDNNTAAHLDSVWPTGMNAEQPETWAWLSFGLPTYAPPPLTGETTVTIRQGLNGAVVKDGMVGGDSICGGSLNYFTEWPEANYNHKIYLVVQMQDEISDFPCYSRAYLSFPLAQVPPGKTIKSAKLIMHLYGSSKIGSEAESSLIQVLRVDRDFDPATLTWNNGPLVKENYGGTWVDPAPTVNIPWPGWAYEWDVSRVVADAYAAGEPLCLALFDADFPMHSGKYFVSSRDDDWNKEGRPTLVITYGNP